MVTRLNSAFHFNIGNVFNSPLFMSLKKGKWRKRPAGNLLTRAQAAQKKQTSPQSPHLSNHPAGALRVKLPSYPTTCRCHAETYSILCVTGRGGVYCYPISQMSRPKPGECMELAGKLRSGILHSSLLRCLLVMMFMKVLGNDNSNPESYHYSYKEDK